MFAGQKLVAYDGYQIALWPTANMRITQGMYGVCPDGTIFDSHKGKMALDINTLNFWDVVYAPYDCKIAAVSTSYNAIVFESLDTVHTSDEVLDFHCTRLLHDGDITGMTVGKIFKQGEKIYDEGGKGPEGLKQYPNHIHLETFRGKYSTRKAMSPIDSFFVNNTKLIEPMDYVWKTYTGKTWEDKLADDAAEAARIAAEEAARKLAEELARQEAERLAAAKEAAQKDLIRIREEEAAEKARIQAEADTKRLEWEKQKEEYYKLYYTVQPGDTLMSIAIKFSTSKQQIYELNKNLIGKNQVVLQQGIILKIPMRKGFVSHLKIGDKVIWSGFTYRDSFGNGKSKKEFQETEGVIDIINRQTYPVHIRGIGWVNLANVKKVS